MHSRGSTAITGKSWHNFWANLVSFSLGVSLRPRSDASRFDRNTNNVIAYWWYDEARDRRTQANKATNTPNYPGEPLNQYDAPEQTWWNEHDLPMNEANQ